MVSHDSGRIADPNIKGQVAWQDSGTTIRDSDCVLLKQEAEMAVFRLLQQQSYATELAALTDMPYPVTQEQIRVRNQAIRANSNLYKLDVFVDNSGILRIGGHLRRADLPDSVTNPILLPGKSPLVMALIRHVHQRLLHIGRGHTLAELRALGLWICGGRRVVGTVVNLCVPCRKLKRPLEVQKLVDLLADKVQVARPFTHSAIDFFGPYSVKQGRGTAKRYGCLFVCQPSRAIHLEMAHSLMTDSFLHCYRRMVGRRGPVRTLHCDTGTNLVGGDNEMKVALEHLDHQRIKGDLLKEGCDSCTVRFNPPRASHIGGSWERLIRSVRAALNALLAKHAGRLTDEELLLLMVEAEARLITMVDTVDPEAEIPLTPFRLLTLKDKVAAPLPGVFDQADVYAKKHWRTVQCLADQFWHAWQREYLPNLQSRSRWNHLRRNVKVGDIVLVVDPLTPCGHWDVGRVISTQTSDDDLVRTVTVRVRGGEYVRLVTKVVLLVEMG